MASNMPHKHTTFVYDILLVAVLKLRYLSVTNCVYTLTYRHYFSMHSRPDISQLNLPHRTKN